MDTDSNFSVPLSTRVEPSLRDDLKIIAERNDRKFADEVRRALRLHVLAEKRISDLEEAS